MYSKICTIITAGFILVILTMNSCDKEPLFNKFEQTGNEAEQFSNTDFAVTRGSNPCIEGLFDNIQVVNGMLKFTDTLHFLDAFACLEYQLEAHLQGFDDLYDHLSPEEMDSMEVVTGFKYWGPLEDFEALFTYNSRIEYIENLIVTFLEQDTPNWENDPDDLDFYDEEFRTLLNENGKAMIGNQVIDFLVLDTMGMNSLVNCKQTVKEVWREVYANNRRVKMKVKVSGHSLNFNWGSQEKAKIVHYKKRKIFSGWKRSREFISARIDAVPRTFAEAVGSGASCIFDFPRDAERSLKKRRQRKARTQPPPFLNEAYYLSGENFGTFKVRRNNQVTYVKTLVW